MTLEEILIKYFDLPLFYDKKEWDISYGIFISLLYDMEKADFFTSKEVNSLVDFLDTIDSSEN